MHQMRISTIQVSSVVLGPKKLEIWGKNVKTVKKTKKQTKQNKKPKQPEILFHEIEPNSSKDRAMHERGNPSL
jgi:Sec-independent protein translocase protein TatA